MRCRVGTGGRIRGLVLWGTMSHGTSGTSVRCLLWRGCSSVGLSSQQLSWHIMSGGEKRRYAPGEEIVPTVMRRVEDERGSHIEPPLDMEWPIEQRLLWHVAVLEEDTGLRCRLTRQETPHTWGFTIDGFSVAGFDYLGALSWLGGVSLGARAKVSQIRREHACKP